MVQYIKLVGIHVAFFQSTHFKIKMPRTNEALSVSQFKTRIMNDTKVTENSETPTDKKLQRQTAIQKALENILEDINTMQHSPEILRRLIKADLGIFYSEVDLTGYCAGLRVGAMLRDKVQEDEKPDFTSATSEVWEKAKERALSFQEFIKTDPNA